MTLSPLAPTWHDQLGSGLSIAAAVIWLFQAALIARVIADLLAGVSSDAIYAAIGLAVLGGLRVVLRAQSDRYLNRSASAIVAEWQRAILVAEATVARPSHLGGPGAIAALATDKLDTLRAYKMRYQPARVRVMIMPALIFAIALSHSWAVALVLLMAGPLIPVFMALVGWAAKAASARQMAEIASLSDVLVDRLAALADLRLIGAGEAVITSFAEASDALRVRTMEVLRIAFLSSTVLELFAALGVAMIAVWVGFSVLGVIAWGSWQAPLTPFAGIYLLLLAPDFFQPLRDLAAAWHDKAAAQAAMDELTAWRDEPRPLVLGQGHSAAPAAFTGLATQTVAARSGTRVWNYPDIALSPGQSLVVTGPSGAGKTTFLRLLAGLTPPESGKVFIGSRELTPDGADAWRASLGWMPQTPHFLARSLRYNIGFGAPLRPDVVRAAHLDPVLRTLPAGDQTLLGERGAGLSGGEARRVMLARALHSDPAILLADEPTADLDSATASDIIAALAGYVAQGGTLVVATHDQRLIDHIGHKLHLDGPA